MDGTGEHHPEQGLARLRRPKIVCLPSYVDFRSRAKAVMLDLGHTLMEEHIREEWASA
jgi:hypothetical protein